MSLSIILMGVGIVLTGQAYSVAFLVVVTFVMSLGFHFFQPTTNAVVLMVMKKQDTPTTLGNLGSLGSIASVAGTGLVLLVTYLTGATSYRPLFTVVGILVVCGGLLLLPFGKVKEALPPGRKVVLRRRYWRYYSLSFLLGSRRHIFTTFAIFLLVQTYHVPIETTAMLYPTLRWTGRLVGRLGERLALSIMFGSLAFVFTGYAYSSLLPLEIVLPFLYLLFVLDNILFGFNIGLTTYFQKIAVTQDEITSNLSTEQAINHVAAIIVSLIGGMAWALYGSRATFLFGVVIVVLGFILTQGVRTGSQARAEPAVSAGGL
jgi:predicted MFS family arabinose efflux permease